MEVTDVSWYWSNGEIASHLIAFNVGTFCDYVIVKATSTIINGCGIYSMTTLLCMVTSEGDGETVGLRNVCVMIKDKVYYANA